VSFTTAVVTASFVSFQQRRIGPETERHEELVERLARIESKLDAIEQQLG
jgi:hypothetical protein